MNKIKVLIADDDGQLSRRMADFVSDHGFEVRVCSSGTTAKAEIINWKPRLILADMMLPDGNAFDLLEFTREDARFRSHKPQVLVMSGHNSEMNVREALSRGAIDYLVKPFRVEDILRRLVFHCRTYRHLTDLTKSEYTSVDEASLMLHLTDLVLRQTITGDSLSNTLYNLTRMVALKVAGVRCSIIHVLDVNTGVVVVSNDDRSASGIELDLNKYPEVLNVVNTGAMIAIENIDDSAEFRLIKSQLRDVMFNSMIVCPISRKQKIFGVMSLRMPAEKSHISDNEMRFVEIVSHVVSLALNNENLKDIERLWQSGRRNTPVVPITRTAKK